MRKFYNYEINLHSSIFTFQKVLRNAWIWIQESSGSRYNEYGSETLVTLL